VRREVTPMRDRILAVVALVVFVVGVTVAPYFAR
jgi:hypothetical protein